MKNTSMLVLGLLRIGALSGCAMATKQSVTGFAYSDVVNAGEVTSNVAGTKMGEACATSYVGVYATGDASVETARRNGGITSITSVDYKTSNILGFLATSCTRVRGK
jgi:hypothetical protein